MKESFVMIGEEIEPHNVFFFHMTCPLSTAGPHKPAGMSELKRKREDNDPEGEEPCAQDATRVAEPNDSPAAPPSPVAPTASVAAAAMPPSTTDINTPIERAAAAALADTAPPASSSSSSGVSATAATTADGDAVVEAAAASTTSAASSSSSPPSARNNERAPKPTKKILICGKEVTLKDTGGRKKRKQPMEALVILAYKGQLAMACKVNSMLSALEIYQEMKSKGIKQDLSVSKRKNHIKFISSQQHGWSSST